MKKLGVFNFISLNGYFEGAKGDTSWHTHGPEENAYGVEAMKAGNTLLFGRVTYDMMASYWPTAMAKQNSPEMAERINKADKVVFSRTLKQADWSNTKVIGGDIVEEIRKMKRLPGKDMAILGSGSIVSLFAGHGLIDEYQIMLDPVALPGGTPMFNTLGRKMNLTLASTRVFKSGVVLLVYNPKS